MNMHAFHLDIRKEYFTHFFQVMIFHLPLKIENGSCGPCYYSVSEQTKR